MTRLDVFCESALVLDMGEIQSAIMDLGLAAEKLLEAKYGEQLQTALASAGLDPALTQKEAANLNLVSEALKAIVATMHLTYGVLGTAADPELYVA